MSLLSEVNKPRKIPYWVIPVILLSVVVFIGVYGSYIDRPCSQPIQYKIGEVDARFGVSQAELNKTMEQAIDVWEQPLEKDLFEYNSDARLTVNLIFDYRQEEANRRKQLEDEINEESDSFDALEKTYNDLVSTYSNRLKAYEAEVSYWNSAGGAPSADYDRLEQERISLNSLANRINNLETKLNTLVDSANRKVNEYNADAGKIYTHGLYEQDDSQARISVYQLDTLEDLRLAIAHEFGHALNLGHATDPKSLMYSILQEQNLHDLQLTSEDLSLIKMECNLN